jgi:Ca2+-binding RTX toxin-like protein
MPIQITTENDDTLPTPLVFGAGDQIQMDKDATIVAPNMAIVGADDASGATMTLLGSVQAGVAVVYAKSGGHTITIGPDGDMSGTTDGILLDAGTNVLGGNIIQNDGSISASNNEGVGINARSSNNLVINTGFIGGAIGVSLGTTDPATHSIAITSNNAVINSDKIQAAATAVALWGDGSSLNNTGTLSGGFATVQLYGTASGKISVENTGIIQSSNGRAIVGSEEMDWIHNAGTIMGSVFLNEGNDFYDGRNGTISGVELGAGNDTAYGGAGFEWFDGGDGNDTLEGGLGDDTLIGGAGIDTAVFTGSVGAIVDLTKADAQDTQYGTDVLTGIENLVGGSGDDIFTGDDEDNALTGGEGNDVLTGGNGSDTAVFTGKIAAQVDLTLSGAPQETGHGLDTLVSIENLAGGEAGDTFTGDSNANVLTGNGGDDTLDGGFGNDVLEGGDGIDTALFNKVIAAVVNLALTGQQNTGYGLDILSGVENLVGGTGADRFTGDGNANKLRGNLGDDTLDGGLGDDELDGGAGIDTVAFSGLTGASVDLASGQAVGHGVDTLIGIENVIGSEGSDNLTGSSGANWLRGGGGSDLVNGGLGDDTLDGGLGLDVLRFTGSTGATVNLALTGVQTTGYGQDTILGFEALWGGAGADRFTDDSGNNAFIGEDGRDTVFGGSGHDTLAGGLGGDRLTGGSGKDLFVFDTKLSKTSNVDTITDFRRVDDSFQLENAIFKKLAKVGGLSKSSFVVGAKAKDKNDYIVYDKAKGVLYYDADGSGKAAAVKFAQLKKGLVIDHKDFFII